MKHGAVSGSALPRSIWESWGVMPLLIEASMECLTEWTPEVLADFVVRLASAVAEYSWAGFDGKPAMGD